jgi:peptide chain release factor subunit 1
MAMQPTRFRPLVDARGPFASVYVDDTHNTADAEKQDELRWRSIAEELSAQGAGDELIDGVRRGLDETVRTAGHGGCAVVVSSGGVRLIERLIRPPEVPTTRVSGLPYLLPMVTHGVDDPPYLVVTVDHAGADVTAHHGGRSDTATVEGEGYPVHKASGAENAGYGDSQRAAEGARQKNIQTAAEQVTAAFDDVSPQLVFVVGEVRSRADLASALPKRVAEKVVEINAGARGSIDTAALAHDIETHLRLRRVDTIDDAAQRFRAELERESGLATEGLAGVCAALRDGAVETLLIGEIGDATVLVGDTATLVAPTPEVMSELGSQESSTVRADEALPFAAVTIDADLISLDERLTPKDGVAAVLRYAPRTSASS